MRLEQISHESNGEKLRWVQKLEADKVNKTQPSSFSQSLKLKGEEREKDVYETGMI